MGMNDARALDWQCSSHVQKPFRCRHRLHRRGVYLGTGKFPGSKILLPPGWFKHHTDNADSSAGHASHVSREPEQGFVNPRRRS